MHRVVKPQTSSLHCRSITTKKLTCLPCTGHTSSFHLWQPLMFSIIFSPRECNTNWLFDFTQHNVLVRSIQATACTEYSIYGCSSLFTHLLTEGHLCCLYAPKNYWRFQMAFVYMCYVYRNVLLEIQPEALTYLLIHLSIAKSNPLSVNRNKLFLWQITIFFKTKESEEWHCFTFLQIYLMSILTEDCWILVPASTFKVLWQCMSHDHL